MAKWKRSVVVTPEVGPVSPIPTVHQFNVRKATSADKTEIKEFITKIRDEFALVVTEEEADLSNIDFQYHARGGTFLVLEEEGKILATAALFPRTLDIGELRHLFVSPCLRGQGLGKKLVKEIVTTAKTLGFHRLEVETKPSLLVARQLFKSFSFKKTRKKVKSGPMSEILVLEQ